MARTYNKRKKSVGVLVGTATLLVGGNAFADYEWGSGYTDGDSFGNSNFAARYSYISREYSNQVTSATGFVRASLASESFWVLTKVFGKQRTVILTSARGHAFQSRTGSNPSQYIDLVQGTVEFNGEQLFSIDYADTPCPGRPTNWSCLSFNKSVSKTLYTAEATFTLAFVPVSVHASIGASLQGGISASSSTGTWAGIHTFAGSANAALNSGANIRANLSAFAGIRGILGVGVGASIRLIEASLAPSVATGQSTPYSPSVTVRIKHANKMPLTLRTLGGSIDVWADISPLWTERMNLINWSGYTWTTPILSIAETVDL